MSEPKKDRPDVPEIKRPRIWTNEHGQPTLQFIDVEFVTPDVFNTYLEASTHGTPLIVVSLRAGWTTQKNETLAWDDERVRAMIGPDLHVLQPNPNRDLIPQVQKMLGDIKSGFQIYAIRDGRLFDTEMPFDNAEELVEWLNAVKQGSISPKFAQKRAGDREGPFLVARRLVYANRLKQAGQHTEALDELMWIVEHVYGTDFSREQVRIPRFAGWEADSESLLETVQRWGDSDVSVHDRLDALRRKMQSAALADPTDTHLFNAWLQFSYALSSTDGLLDFWKLVQHDGRLAEDLEDYRIAIIGAFFQAKQPRLGADLIGNAFDIVNGQFRLVEGFEQIFGSPKPGSRNDPSLRESMQSEICGQCAIAYACLLAAGRDADAQFLADEVIRRSKWDGCKAYLVELALQVGEPREVHRTWAKEVMQLPEIRAEADLVNRVDEALAKQASKK